MADLRSPLMRSGWRIRPIDESVTLVETSRFKRSLGPIQLIMLGLSAIVGTGIFILLAVAVQKGGPSAILAFAIAGFVCSCAALCYAELGSMVPTAGGSYSYAYCALGEVAAWAVGWALLAEYMLGASAISVGWASYVTDLIETAHQSISWLPAVSVPHDLTVGYFAGGLINLPAVLIIALVTILLILGTRTGVNFAMVLVVLKIAALLLFVLLAAKHVDSANFRPFMPLGIAGTGAAAASIFFAYLGFDGVASAAEEVRSPQRDVPIGILGAVFAATLLYLLVSAAAIGAVGGAPVSASDGQVLSADSLAFSQRCSALASAAIHPLACSDQALAQALRTLHYPKAASIIGMVVFVALPSAIVSTLYAQSRLMFALARDGLLPRTLAEVHPRLKTPVRMIALAGLLTGLLAAFVPIGQLADVTNAGTLFAFLLTSVALLVLRRRDPLRNRPFRLPAAWLIAPLAILGCAALFLRLPPFTLAAFALWLVAGAMLYVAHGRRHSRMAVA